MLCKCLVPGNTVRYTVFVCAAPPYWKFIRVGRMGKLEQWSSLPQPFDTYFDDRVHLASFCRSYCLCFLVLLTEIFWSGHGAMVSGFIDWLLRVCSLGSTNWWHLPLPAMSLQHLSLLSIYHKSPRPHDVQPQSPNHPMMRRGMIQYSYSTYNSPEVDAQRQILCAGKRIALPGQKQDAVIHSVWFNLKAQAPSRPFISNHRHRP